MRVLAPGLAACAVSRSDATILPVGCYFAAKVKLAEAIDFGAMVIWMSCSPRVSWTAARV